MLLIIHKRTKDTTRKKIIIKDHKIMDSALHTIKLSVQYLAYRNKTLLNESLFNNTGQQCGDCKGQKGGGSLRRVSGA